jgi:hypothetical protein
MNIINMKLGDVMIDKDNLIDLNLLIKKLDDLIDIMIESTKHVIDIGNVNYELNNVLDKLDIIIDSLNDSDEKSRLETAKDHITYASVDILDDADIFYKINRLKIAKSILTNIKAKMG